MKTEQVLATKRLALVALMGAALLLPACGKFKLVEDFRTQTIVDEAQNLWLKASVKINLGLITLPSAAWPIRSNGVQVGVVKIQSPNNLSLEANITTLSKDRLSRWDRLPNGDQVPVSGMQDVFGISISSRSMVYFAVQNQQTMLGVAVVIPELDRIGDKNPLSGIWWPVDGATGSKGLVGIFTSRTASSSGLGFFVTSPVAPAAAPAASGSMQLLSQENSKLQKALIEQSTQRQKVSVR